jgi:arsenate reductase (thioredoxin)
MPLKRVLFVCLGNACRSQMAEGFARAYGRDVMEPASAGLAPALAVPAETRQIMAEKNIDISSQFPKPLTIYPRDHYFDIVVNISGYPIPGYPHAKEWKVNDPIGGTAEEYRAARDQIEQFVMKLIVELRRKGSRKGK